MVSLIISDLVMTVGNQLAATIFIAIGLFKAFLSLPLIAQNKKVPGTHTVI